VHHAHRLVSEQKLLPIARHTALRCRPHQPSSETSDRGGSHGRFHDPQAKPSRFVAQGGHLPLPGLRRIVCRAEVTQREPMPQQVVAHTRAVVGRGHDRCCGAATSPQALAAGSSAMVAATDRLGRHPQGLSGTLAGLQRAPGPDVPARVFLTGAHPHHAQNALALGHCRRSRPRSERRVGTGLACSPGLASKSTPVS
jgi:hypothetical protein